MRNFIHGVIGVAVCLAMARVMSSLLTAPSCFESPHYTDAECMAYVDEDRDDHAGMP
jgi:hypothetical protein